MDITGFVDSVKPQIIAAAIILFSIFAVVFIKNRNFLGFIGFGLLFGVITYSIVDPMWFSDVSGWIIEGVTR